MPYYTECDTNRQAVIPPSRPKFKFNVLHSDSGRYARIKVTWQPQIEGNPGSHFYVQYKKDMATQFKSSEEELNQDSIVVGGKKNEKTKISNIFVFEKIFQWFFVNKIVLTFCEKKLFL